MTYNTAKCIERAARIGYVTKGILYSMIGVLAVRLAIGEGGSTEGKRGVIQAVADEPFGQIILAAVTIGLLFYGLWKLIAAYFNPEENDDDAKGAVKRAAYVVSGIIYLGLAVWTAALLLQSGSGGEGGGQSWSAWLMSKGIGPYLFGLAGAATIGAGAVQFYRAYKEKFVKHYDRYRMSATEWKWAKYAGQFGISARGVVFCITGVFLIFAALQQDSDEARGLEGALDVIARQPYGSILLALVAAGLIAYGVYCFARARYGHFRVS